MDFLIIGGIIFVIIFIVVIAHTVAQTKRENSTDKLLAENGFTTTRCAGSLRVDDTNKKWCINNGQNNPVIYDFSEVLNCKIEENSVLNKVNRLGVYIYTKNGGAIYISLINTETKRDSFTYNTFMATANQIDSIVQSLISHSAEKSPDLPEAANSNSETADIGDIEEQLKKLKSMLDSGLITNEDFEAKKKQLLGI